MTDYPWREMYRRAIAGGIGDDAFWRMSPAALILVTSGGRRRSRGRAERMESRQGGSIAQCP